MIETMGGGMMMWGMGVVCFLLAILVLLGIAALAKYLFLNRRD